mmetsp:Transcript_600/g.1230  ORF Transcript_600/g.1230 Transcript_600/m.1230 type:complete len:295 (+) Transcript_600:892-1776(+)
MRRMGHHGEGRPRSSQVDELPMGRTSCPKWRWLIHMQKSHTKCSLPPPPFAPRQVKHSLTWWRVGCPVANSVTDCWHGHASRSWHENDSRFLEGPRGASLAPTPPASSRECNPSTPWCRPSAATRNRPASAAAARSCAPSDKSRAEASAAASSSSSSGMLPLLLLPGMSRPAAAAVAAVAVELLKAFSVPPPAPVAATNVEDFPVEDAPKEEELEVGMEDGKVEEEEAAAKACALAWAASAWAALALATAVGPSVSAKMERKSWSLKDKANSTSPFTEGSERTLPSASTLCDGS